MSEQYAYVLVAPDGSEHVTNSEQYRNRLLAQGYREKPQDEPASVTPAPVRAQQAPSPEESKPEDPDPGPAKAAKSSR